MSQIQNRDGYGKSRNGHGKGMDTYFVKYMGTLLFTRRPCHYFPPQCPNLHCTVPYTFDSLSEQWLSILTSQRQFEGRVADVKGLRYYSMDKPFWETIVCCIGALKRGTAKWKDNKPTPRELISVRVCLWQAAGRWAWRVRGRRGSQGGPRLLVLQPPPCRLLATTLSCSSWATHQQVVYRDMPWSALQVEGQEKHGERGDSEGPGSTCKAQGCSLWHGGGWMCVEVEVKRD